MGDEKKGRPLTIWIPFQTYDKLEETAVKLNMTRSRLATNLIISGMDDVNMADKLGVLSALKAIEKAKETLCKLSESVRTVVA